MALPDLVRDIGLRRGETIRVCGGRWVEPRRTEDGRLVAWTLSQPGEPPYRFPISVLVAPCGEERPKLDRGCITGRIAREDGSQTLPENIFVGSHGLVSEEWWLHPQCTRAPRFISSSTAA
jgi:hypothetical protein